MSNQRQKRIFLSVLFSSLRGSTSHPPSPNNVVQAGVCGTPSGVGKQPSRAPLSTESLADTSRIPVISIDDSQIVNESHDQRPDPQRWSSITVDPLPLRHQNHGRHWETSRLTSITVSKVPIILDNRTNWPLLDPDNDDVSCTQVRGDLLLKVCCTGD